MCYSLQQLKHINIKQIKTKVHLPRSDFKVTTATTATTATATKEKKMDPVKKRVVF